MSCYFVNQAFVRLGSNGRTCNLDCLGARTLVQGKPDWMNSGLLEVSLDF